MTMPDNKVRCAEFVLREALGTDVIVHVPKQVPTETREWFYRQLYELKAEVIALIQRENAGGHA